jgi:hypothetical protein
MKWLILAAFALAGAAPGADGHGPRLVQTGEITWRDHRAGFGGFSGLALMDDGRRFVTVSDRGRWATGTLTRDAAGRLTGARTTALGPLHAISGDPLEGENVDAEGVAVDARGRVWVSFEAFHRVRRYDRLDGPATDVPGHPDFPSLQNNSALEALAIDAAGTLYAIPERSGAWERPFPVYRFRDGRWDRTLSIPRSGRFLVAGADVGPDGHLYIVERDFRWLGGFATRVRRFALGPDGFDAGTTLLGTSFGTLDNMESISVWTDDAGRTRVTLLSDDNFQFLQSTMFTEYVLVE